ncbi:MAG: methyltransferase domain-containing protein [Parvibaculum sp.]|uniref:class I SAM-dependent methyltransferase n=1 Tax=Parvibaculum sp. TaxID=2024848 RepID=UPI002842F812|nr:methyltransferase domain-containing protein [Parvibaculum sp.]MDR3499402.1 methyltransferase domain-containing protein [Parvibaculum sp.]
MSKMAHDITYHDNARIDIFNMLPSKCSRVLEIGVGTGATIVALKDVRKVEFTAGVELSEVAGARARGRVDEVLVADIEKSGLPDHWRDFDLILCLDVLEHLVDPWRVVERLHERLAPGGVVLASIPNVNHISASLPLLLRGEWKLVDAGILDRTHLRFFVKKTAIELMTCSGLHLQAISLGGLPRHSKRWWANKLTVGLFERFLALQYYIRSGN